MHKIVDTWSDRPEMHRLAETGRAAAWNRATEAILESFPAVAKVNKS